MFDLDGVAAVKVGRNTRNFTLPKNTGFERSFFAISKKSLHLQS